MPIKGVIFDLDDTLVDTSPLLELRKARRWREAVQRLGDTSLFNGIDDLFRVLAADGMSRAVVTTSVSFYADNVLAHHGLSLSPRMRIAYHCVTPHKPHPAPIMEALARMDLAPADVLGVGDSAIDLQAYRAAGVRAVGAGWSPVLHTGTWDAIAATPTDVVLMSRANLAARRKSR